jgi:hypothetical protein
MKFAPFVMMFACVATLDSQGAAGGSKCTVLVEAESFSNTGGWVVDPQFMDQMGSPDKRKPVAKAEGTS